jgi:isoleucyl-tRNA synthetase
MYKEFKGLNLPTIDKEILEFWEKEKIFEKSYEQRDPQNSFVFYEGPPSANGMPGIHHVMARTIKDIFCRFQTLNGKRVERKGGWDTHGLPIELAVEKELGITKEDIGKKISVDDYNHKCRETVMRFKDSWDEVTVKSGYWVDLDNPYITYENSYIETVWFLLKRLYEKDFLYKGYTIQPYSPAAGTGLSSHELNMPGTYKDVTDTTVVAMFKVKKSLGNSGQATDWGWLFDDENEDVRILAWTTTPWTLPSNTALTVGPNIDYVKIKTKNPYTHVDVSVVCALPLVSKWFGGKNQPTIEHQSASFKGEILRGVRYEQLLDFGNEIQPLNGKTDAFKVITDTFVTTEDGTGVVHTAPSFGAEDRKAAAANGIGDLTLVDKQGKFVDNVGEFSGRYVKNYTDDVDYVDVNVDIAVKLKLEGYAFNVQKYVHPYPHCWRTDKPILYYPLDSWFIAASKAKERMFELNKTINWKPAATGEGRFGKWLENLQDWNLSRSRYWGIPLPIWRNRDLEMPTEKMIGSLPELQAEIEKANTILGLNQVMPKDLHRPYIDEIILVSDDGEKLYRELDLIDVWFDSGSMPYAQWGSPPQSPQRGEASPTHEGIDAVWATANPQFYNIIKEFAKQNRKNPTQAEDVLWQNLRGKKLEGYKFRRQHQIADFIVDFICLEKRLIIEADGGYHNSPEMQEYDKARSRYLGYYGYKVIRFTNEEIIANTEGVLEKIYLALCQRPTLTKDDIKAGWHKHPPFGGAGGGFPADFIAEGVDQTRGWFYTLHAIAVMAYDTIAFKNVVSNGLVQDKDGQKMSKSKGNAVEPFETIAKHGADATRWYMVSNAQPWDNLKFDIEGITEVRNKFFGTLYNTYNFFAMYANVDGFQQDEMNQTPIENRIELDRWVLSRLHSLVAEVSAFYSDYEPTQAARAIEKFVDSDFSNWYVRLSRRRFWKAAPLNLPKGETSASHSSLSFGEGRGGADKKAAYETMYQCLMVVGQLAAPIAPFFSDWMYRNLTENIRAKAIENNTPLRHASVHLSDLTKSDNALIDKELEQRMDYAQRISSLILSLRKKAKIRVRQPLQKAMLPILDANFIEQVEGVKDLILAETNVKTFEYITDTSGVVKKKIKPNFKTLGKTLGANMKFAQTAIEALTQDDIAQIEKDKTFNLAVNGESYPLSIDDFLITSEDIPGWEVASDGEVTVALDITLNEALIAEGTARDLVNKIQNIRKDKNFDITDRIHVTIEKHETILDAVAKFSDYIKGEVLADSLVLADAVAVDKTELNDEVSLGIEVRLN